MKSPEQKKQAERTIVKEVTALGASRYLSEFISAIRGFVIASFLGPAFYGIWNILKVFIYSSEYFGLGTTHAMIRQIPYNAGKNKDSENAEITQSVLCWGLWLSFLAALFVFLGTFTPLLKHHLIEIRLASLAFMLNYLYYYAGSKLNAEKKIILLSKYNFAYAALNALFGLSFLFLFQIKGLLIGMIISQFILLLHLWLYKNFPSTFHINIKILARLLKIGFPIMLLAVSFVAMQKIDSVIIFILLGSTKTGYYGLAAFIAIIIHHIPISMSRVLLPKMMHKYGRTNEKEELEEYFAKPVKLLSISMPVILGLIFININLPVTYLLPKYAPSLSALKVLTLSLFFTAMIRIPANILIAFNKQKVLICIMVSALLIGALLDYGIIRLGYGIVGVAFATGFIFFMVSLIFSVYALISFHKSQHEIYLTIIKIYLPFIYSLLILLILNFTSTLINNLFITSLIQSILFIFMVTPLWVPALRKDGLFYQIISAYRTSRQFQDDKKSTL